MQHKKQLFQIFSDIAQLNQSAWDNPRGSFDAKLEHDMLLEEVNELATASTKVDQLDALLDVIYVAVGSLHKLGLNPEQMVESLQVVHDANKQKSGTKRSNGKVSKPDNFIPPEDKLSEILVRAK